MIRTTLAALFVLAAFAPAPARAGDCKPVYGFYTSQIQPPESCGGGFCTAGELIGGLQADYAFVATGFASAGALSGDGALATVLFYVGKSTVTSKHAGDQLFASDAGAIDQGALGKQAALLVVSGGTGAYAGATGFLQLRGTLEAGGHVTGDYFGQICAR